MTQRKSRKALWAACLGALMAGAPTVAPAADIKELERRIEVLAEEIERLKLQEAAAEPELSSQNGLGPAASKIYKKGEKKVSLGGYGEMIYSKFQGRRQNNATAGMTDRLDLVRAILYVGYKFNDWITFNSEIEFEHGNEAVRGEVGVEMAALDLKPWDSLGFRLGLLLMPVGLVNEIHEPTTFHGANRPNVEQNIYPTTWRENGAGIFGKIGPVSYRSYAVAGLQAVTDGTVTGFSGSSGVRSGRSKGSNSRVSDFAWVGRVDVEPIEDVLLGASLYAGQADHGMAASIPVTFWDVHAKGRWKGLEARALYVEGRIGNVDTLNVGQGIARGSNASVGRHLFGGYAELAYDVLSLVPATDHYLAPFFRYERYDTQRKVPGGYLKNPANSRVEYTMGLTYKPIPQVVLKADHQILRNQGWTGVGRTNFGAGYIF